MKTTPVAVEAILNKQRGFTLIEMVTVIAIMGIMAAVAVPMVNSQLGRSREQSYAQDVALIQTAVDSYVNASNNVRNLGQRQFPIAGATNSLGNPNILKSDENGPHPTLLFNDTTNLPAPVSVADMKSPENPLRGIQGGEPKWRDGGEAKDGNRALDADGYPIYSSNGATASEEGLNDPASTAANAGYGESPTGGWYVDKVTFQGQNYAVDSRDYFIDFSSLVSASFLQGVPKSASPDNPGGSTSGSYSWYIDAHGSVKSLFYFLPSNGDAFVDTDQDPADDGTLDARGFFEGVYPQRWLQPSPMHTLA